MNDHSYSWKKDLEGPALRIAESDDDRLRVLAGPGTGKTYAMMRRVARLLEEGQDPRRVLAVTFTRNSAADLVDALRDLNIEGCRKVRAGTLHSFCFSVLSQAQVLPLLGRVARPVISYMKSGCLRFEAEMTLHDLHQFGGKRYCTNQILAFEAAWARRQDDIPGGPTFTFDQHFERSLKAWLRFHRSVLIGELVPLTLDYLKTNPVAPELAAFDHVIVDEYQDLNRAEQELLDELVRNSNVTVVGDPNQSIYSFRYANPEAITKFDERHCTTQDETIEECHRCPRRVVTLANHLMTYNPNSESTRLKALPKRRKGRIFIVQWEDMAQEAEGLAAYVRELVEQRGIRPKDVMVLCPRREIGYGIRDLLKGWDVPAHSFFHEEALDSTSAQEAFCLLTLLADEDDRTALRWWLGRNSSTGLRGGYARLREYCEATNKSPRGALEELARGRCEIPYANRLLPIYEALVERLEALGGLPMAQLIDEVFPEGSRELWPLREVALTGAGRVSTAQEMYAHVRDHITHPEVPREDVVQVMSLHKSKGLTRKIVVVASCCQGLIPTRSKELQLLRFESREQELEEQRRLFYVAITRCKKVLVLSSFRRMEYADAMRMNAHAPAGVTTTSRFIRELGPTAPRSQSGIEWSTRGYR
ncbi:MAG: ATP-dependent helicase [Holophagales bacterium]|nr:ATP-dependent helicase [Holophagales bacterium]MYJ24316.1 ATP-dependent helicase [Holophagales bacterium]